MNAKTNIRIVIQLLIAMGAYALFDAESLAESWKQRGVPAPLADPLSSLGKKSGLAGMHESIRSLKAIYRDIDVAEYLTAMRMEDAAPPLTDQHGSHEDLSTGATPPQAPQEGMAAEARPCPAPSATGTGPMSATPDHPSGDHDQEHGAKDLVPYGETRGSSPAEGKDDKSSAAGGSSHAAGQQLADNHTGPAAQDAGAGTDLPETGVKYHDGSPEPHETLPEPPQELDPQNGHGSSPAPESDPAAKALRELMLQQKDPGTVPLPHAGDARDGHTAPAGDGSTTLKDGSEGGDGPSTISDLLKTTYYAHIESPAQEYKRRTESKVMFEKPLSKSYTVLLAGDSFMEEMTLSVGRGSYYRKSGIIFHSIARYSTGLTSVKDWDWKEKLAEGIEKYRPDIVLILLGANDMMGIVEDKKILAYKSKSWENKYRERAEALLDTALESNVMPIWIGLPVMTHEPFKTGIPIISRLHEEACANKGTVYVSTLKTLADEHGEYQAYRMDANGKKLRLRKKDKCHIAADGMLLVLDEVMPYIRQYVEYRETMDKPSQREKED
ncbi:MAG: hypothetical protein ACQGQP_00495 [Desulfovibrio sp.]